MIKNVINYLTEVKIHVERTAMYVQQDTTIA